MAAAHRTPARGQPGRRSPGRAARPVWRRWGPPAAIEVPLAAAGQPGQQRAQVARIWRQRLERADYQAERARRQYQLVEPENRLVARQLEKDWEAALAERQRLG